MPLPLEGEPGCAGPVLLVVEAADAAPVLVAPPWTEMDGARVACGLLELPGFTLTTLGDGESTVRSFPFEEAATCTASDVALGEFPGVFGTG